MICEKCGQWIEDGSKACSSCGAPVNVQNAQSANGTAGGQQSADAGSFNANYAGAGQPNPPVMTKKEFYKHPNIASLRSQIRGAGIACYIFGGLSLIFAFSIVDALLLVGLGLGIHLGRSRACAIILTVYGAFNLIYVLLAEGTVSGWLIPLAGVYAIIYTFKYQSAWTEYQKTGNIQDFSAPNKKNK